MKKLFVSQPMRGISDTEILANFKTAHRNAEILTHRKLEMIESYQPEAYERDPEETKRKNIDKLLGADIVYFCAGWEIYAGCRLEHDIAMHCGIPAIEARADGFVLRNITMEE